MRKLRTPIAALNIVGAGGLDWGSFIECWGGPKGGKSTFCYQTAGYAVQDYGDEVIVLILDSEASGSLLRLRRVFGLSPCNVIDAVDPNPNIFKESAFTFESVLLKVGLYLEKAKASGKRLIVIWDSITSSHPTAEHDAVQAAINKMVKSPDDADDAIEMFKSGMMIRPRMLKFCLNNLLALAYNELIVVFLINQATTSISKYTTSETSSGGYALKHNCHNRFKFEYTKPLSDAAINASLDGGDIDKKEDVYKTGTLSMFNADKSKFGAVIFNVPVFIDDRAGGLIRDGDDIVYIAERLGLIKSGAWCKFTVDDLPDGFNKGWRWTELLASKEVKDFCTQLVTKHFRSQFTLLDWEYQEQEEAANANS